MNGKFWEGDWEGSVIIKTEMSLVDINTILDDIDARSGLPPQVADVVGSSVSPMEYSVKLHLESDPEGRGASPESFARFEVLTDLQTSSQVRLLGQVYPGSEDVSAKGSVFKSRVILTEKSVNRITT